MPSSGSLASPDQTIYWPVPGPRRSLVTPGPVPWEPDPMAETVQTVRGPVPASELGRVFMHEHVFVLNEEIRQNYATDWDEDKQVDSAVAKLSALERRGVAT